jgi:hexosaminidase
MLLTINITSLDDMRKHLLTLFCCASTFLCGAQMSSTWAIIPVPSQIEPAPGRYGFECAAVSGDAILRPLLDLFSAELEPLIPTIVQCEVARPIRLSLVEPNANVPPETYWLSMGNGMEGMDLKAATLEGLFRGTRTILQLAEQAKRDGSIPCCTITDAPRFSWRGMHLDVCRHFFPVDFVKKYIDLLARYKMNTFHWHLTDDQGWRIEIKKYPKLTETGGWRNGSEYGPYSDRTYDSTRYGGFYTQDEIRDVVAYARDRHITVVPEIEMPGHALAALASYPELSCTNGSFEVAKGWGVFDDVFCPKEGTFTFLENVLAEVIDLFPGEYIHIGGDECPKERWKACPQCQSRMKTEGLKDEHELQSYFIRRIEKFVNSKGRKIIGWDEILEGGLAPNAAVMSWRGTEGGAAAAKQKHAVVMCPGSHCYFDHYQGDPAYEPLAIGGHTTVQKTYSYEPVPAELNPEEASYILGAQGNVWTEYITTTEQVEYMALPRMIALAEVLWSPKEKRDEVGFVRRLEEEFKALSERNVNVCKSLYNVGFNMNSSKKRGQVNVALGCTPGLGEIRYTLDRTAPTKDSPLFVSTLEQRGSGTIRAALFRDGRELGHSTERNFAFDLATGKAITVTPAPSERYNDGGNFALVDGISAGSKRVNSEWLGWKDDHVKITVDLGEEQWLSHISLGALSEKYAWIHAPAEVEIAVSTDGAAYLVLDTPKAPIDAIGHISFSASTPMMARYVRFVAKSIGRIPEGNAGAGDTPWMFLDEIHIR